MELRCLAFGVLLVGGAAIAQPPPRDALTGGLLVSDLTLDKVFLCRDLNADGDADDAGEVTVYYDATGALGTGSGSVFSILQMEQGVLIGDGDTDTIYVLEDLNADGDCLDAGEAHVGFAAATNASGFPLETPQGLAMNATGSVFASTSGAVGPDAVYKFDDTNDDGDAQDPNESSLWVLLATLVTNSVPFSIASSGEDLYIVDQRASASDVIFRARDLDGSGSIDASELSIFYDSASGLGLTAIASLMADGGSLYAFDLTASISPQRLMRLTDLDGNGSIDSANEAVEIWNETFVPAGYTINTAFDLALGPNDTIALTSNASGDAGDNIFLLTDQDGDGKYITAGETTVFVSGHGTGGTFVENPRAARFILPPQTPGCLVTCDYNDDGGGDNADVTDLANAIASDTDPFPTHCKDYNQDGGADNADVTDLANAIAGGSC